MPLTKTTHLGVSVKGLQRELDNDVNDALQIKTWQILFREDGTLGSKEDVQQAINDARAKGWDVITSSSCDNIGKNGRCMGHEKSQVEEVSNE